MWHIPAIPLISMLRQVNGDLESSRKLGSSAWEFRPHPWGGKEGRKGISITNISQGATYSYEVSKAIKVIEAKHAMLVTWSQRVRKNAETFNGHRLSSVAK